jgi:ABC-type arginine/histidine transport system permease subunit
MVRYALPGFTNNWLVLIKATALVSLIGLQEMTYAAKQASAATRSPFQFFLFTAALFLLYTWSRWWCCAGSMRASAWVQRGTLNELGSHFRSPESGLFGTGIATTLCLLFASLGVGAVHGPGICAAADRARGSVRAGWSAPTPM